MKKYSSLNASHYMESAWKKSQAALNANNAVSNEQTKPVLLSYNMHKRDHPKDEAMHAAQQKLLASNTESRCQQLQDTPKDQLAHEYLLLSTAAYDLACQRRSYQPEPSIRGTDIHQIAESLARIDRSRAEQCPMLRYPFDGIEQCYFLGQLAGFGYKLPCGAQPDLIDTSTGEIFDFKTGSKGTDLNRHRKNSKHVPPNTTGKVASHDVTVHGVQLKYFSKVSLHRPTNPI